jgi:large subunit ribosomal protein L19
MHQNNYFCKKVCNSKFNAYLCDRFWTYNSSAMASQHQDLISYVHIELNTHRQWPSFKAGDNVIVNYRIDEGDKARIQAYRGDVIQIKGHGATKTFTVRKISNAVGVERIFPFSSPFIDSIEVTKRGRVRRARLFYLRDMIGKKARIKELGINSKR